MKMAMESAFSFAIREGYRTILMNSTIAQRYPGCELTVAYIDSYGESVGASWIAD